MKAERRMNKVFEKPVGHTKLSRALSAHETVFSDCANFDAKASTYCHVNIFESEKPIAASLVRACIHELSKQHFLLRTCARRNEDDVHIFEEMENLDENGDWIPIKCCKMASPHSWNNLLSEELKQPFDFVKGPMWRVVWVTCAKEQLQYQYVLLFIGSHGIIDAKSSVDLFANQFLPRLNNLLDNLVTEDFPKPIEMTKSGLELFSSLVCPKDSLQNYPVPWMKKKVLNSLIWFLRKIGHNVEPPAMKVTSGNRDAFPAFYHFQIESELLNRLHTVCRKNMTSIHAILMVILTNIFKDAGKVFTNFNGKIGQIVYPVDLRKFNKFLHTSPLPLGYHVSILTKKVRPCPMENVDGLFKYAQHLTRDIRKSNQPIAMNEFLLPTILLARKDLVKEFHKFIPQSLVLSNLGDCDQLVNHKPGASVRLTEQYFSMPAWNSIFVTTSTLNRKMLFCIGYNNKWFDDSFGEFLEKKMRDLINEIANI